MLLRLAAFVVLTAVLWIALAFAWSFAATTFFEHGSLSECDRGDCGTLGEFTWDTWPLVPLLLGLLAATTAYLIAFRARRRSA